MPGPRKIGVYTAAGVRTAVGLSMRNLERLTRITAWNLAAYERGAGESSGISTAQIRTLDRFYGKLAELLEVVS